MLVITAGRILSIAGVSTGYYIMTFTFPSNNFTQSTRESLPIIVLQIIYAGRPHLKSEKTIYGVAGIAVTVTEKSAEQVIVTIEHENKAWCNTEVHRGENKIELKYQRFESNDRLAGIF